MNENIKVKSENEVYNITLAKHLLEHRETLKGVAKGHRSLQINNKRYKQIFTLALKHGLTSFRNKGVIVVTFKDTKGKVYGVLCDLNSMNDIFIITVFRGPKNMDIDRCFIKVHNRINISYYYTMYVLTEQELTKNKHKRSKFYASESVTKEDVNMFEKAMECLDKKV